MENSGDLRSLCYTCLGKSAIGPPTTFIPTPESSTGRGQQTHDLRHRRGHIPQPCSPVADGGPQLPLSRWNCAVHTLIPDGAQKLLCVLMGVAAPRSPMPATQSRDKISVYEAEVQRTLWLLRDCWECCELELCFPPLPSLQVQACFLRCMWGWRSPQGSAWPRALFPSSHWPSACISILLPDTIPLPKFFLKIPQDHHKVQILPALSQQQKAVSSCVQTQTGLFKSLGFPGGASGKEPGYQCRTYGMWVRSLGGDGLTWRRAWQPIPVFLPGESLGQRSLASYSPQGHRVKHDWSDLACTASCSQTTGDSIEN